MTFDEIDSLVNSSLKKYKNTERRDYYKLEKQWLKAGQTNLRNYGKENGIMYLVDVDNSHYIDIRILENSVRLTFRHDDTEFMDKSFSYEIFTKDHLSFFFYAIDDYLQSDTLFDKFNRGEIPQLIIRENKLNEIL